MMSVVTSKIFDRRNFLNLYNANLEISGFENNVDSDQLADLDLHSFQYRKCIGLAW